MLYEFLVENREKLLAMTGEKIAGISQDRPTTEKSQRGLPEFYDHMIYELKRESQGLPKDSEKSAHRKHGQQSTAMHGRELSRLGYTVSQVVHGYGVLCQAVTELAGTNRVSITPREFSVLNLSLDIAIAEAVTGFVEQKDVKGVDSAKRMGFLIHELRNALGAVVVSHTLIKKGVVGAAGNTNALMERNLNNMRDLLDRSFLVMRMQNGTAVDSESLLLLRIIEEVEATASEEADLKALTIKVEIPPQLQITADHHCLLSALSNLVQNAIQFSKKGGAISVRGRETNKSVVLEVEDQCGGLPKGKAEELFQPFTQKNSDRTGLGLGLTISRQAVALNGGTLEVRDLPGKGCIFAITLPKYLEGKPPRVEECVPCQVPDRS